MGLNVSVADDLTRFVEAKVQSGEYPSADAVVEDALRLLEESQKTDEEKLAWLRAAIEEGEASGDAGPLDIEALISEARRRREAGSSVGPSAHASRGARPARHLEPHRSRQADDRQ